MPPRRRSLSAREVTEENRLALRSPFLAGLARKLLSGAVGRGRKGSILRRK